jgi:hypothetical protein
MILEGSRLHASRCPQISIVSNRFNEMSGKAGGVTVGSDFTAEELAQDVFVRVANRPRGIASRDAYVFTIVAILLRDRNRRRPFRAAGNGALAVASARGTPTSLLMIFRTIDVLIVSTWVAVMSVDSTKD